MPITDNIEIDGKANNPIERSGESAGFFSKISLHVTRNREIKIYIALVIATSLYLAIHLITLSRSPLPWFDDTFFASVAESLYKNGELKLTVSPLWFDKPVYIYGPAYFVITGAALNWFGIDVFVFRMPNFLFSMGVLYMAFLLLRQRNISLAINVSVCALLAIDSIFYRAAHTGRMDSMALFFLLSSLYFLLKGKNETPGKSLSWILLSGISAGVALITTPRPIYLAILLGMILLHRCWRHRSRSHVIQLIAWTIVCLSPWTIWFFYAFGNLHKLWDYYAAIPGGTYVGGFGIRPEQYPLLFGLLILLCVRLISSKTKLLDELLFFVAGGIIGYYVLVHDDGGAYAFFMVPLAYMGLGVLAAEVIGQLDSRLPFTVIGVLMLINIAAYSARNTMTWLEWGGRDPKLADYAIAKFIPRGSKVVGDDKYYFAVKKNGSDFQYAGRGGSVAERTAYHSNVYRADFLILDDDGSSNIAQSYIEVLRMKPIGVIDVPEVHPFAVWIDNMAARLGHSTSRGYKGMVWARVH